MQSGASLDSGIVELLDCDPRATFVVSQRTWALSSTLPVIAFANAALQKRPELQLALSDGAGEGHEAFCEWVKGVWPAGSGQHGLHDGGFAYLGQYWTRSVLGGRWIVVGSNEQEPVSDRAHARRKQHPRPRSHSFFLTAPTNDVNVAAVSDAAAGDEISNIRPGESFVLVVDSFDWASTPLGPMSHWPLHLQQTFNQVLADSRPIAIYWGEQLATLYNEAFSKLCGAKHPGLLGKPVEEAWPDFCDKIKQTMVTSATKRRASLEEEWRFFAERADGSCEETYLKWSIVPIMENNQCVGFLQPMSDMTSMRLWERRMKMLIDLGDLLVTARDTKSYWGKTIEAIEAWEPSYDAPLAILYSVQGDPDPSCDWSKPHEFNKICHLEGTLGIPKGRSLTPETLILDGDKNSLSYAFKTALEAKAPTVLHRSDGTYLDALLTEAHWRGFQDPCREAVILSIRPTKEEHVMGFLVLGLNPRRPYDSDYKQFISLLSQKLTTTLASTVLLEEEARRGRNIAEQHAYDEAMLKEKLALRTKEATESTSKFQAVAEFIPVGMCFGDPDGNITFANDAWYRIMGLPTTVSTITPDVFLSHVMEADRGDVIRAFAGMKYTRATTVEFRVYKDDLESPPIGNSTGFEKTGLDLHMNDAKERHIMAALKAEYAHDGTILRVLTCLTDVTFHKRTAEEAIRRAQQAENLKKAGEFAFVGLCEMSADGRVVWANNVFYKMCGWDQEDPTQRTHKRFDSCIVDQDLPELNRTLGSLVAEGSPQVVEIRFKTLWTEKDRSGNENVVPRCVVATFMPVKTADGSMETFTGCLVDMSLQKAQVEMERQRKEEAIEAKRQQDLFIDMTSHELRNPLTAITHASEAIIANQSRLKEIVEECISEWQASSDPSIIDSLLEKIKEPMKLAADSIDYGEIIGTCAQHQKRIVDDILLISKMDSNLLSITPVTADPIEETRTAVNMFRVEARRVDIDLEMVVDRSYRDLDIDFLDLDPSRLKQILINLLTNALKFTMTQSARRVTITLRASRERPTEALTAVRVVTNDPKGGGGSSSGSSNATTPKMSNRGADALTFPVGEGLPPSLLTRTKSSLFDNLSFGPGPTYLIFEVKDTGQGLNDVERASLFQRFKQASPKTHVRYGGSGLGLFVCKRLVELQGGAIGVTSKPGQGSTFIFYVEAHSPSRSALEAARAARTAATATAMTAHHVSVGKTEPVAPFARKKVEGVLVVEDNLVNRQMAVRSLEKKGYRVESAEHGLDALAKLESTNRRNGDFPLSLILMDMEMPVQDGLTCTRQIREWERTGRLKGPRIPILVVSANARNEHIQAALAAGGDDMLVKPYKIPELEEKMEKLVGRLDQRNSKDPPNA
jgi:signal transduction histidine kinase/FixJ family two-component response regulator